MTDRLPCPFCGDTQLGRMDMVYVHADGPTQGVRIKCNTCGAQAPDTIWNKRLGTQLPARSNERNSTDLLTNYASGWNDCLDAAARLNGLPEAPQ